MLLDVTRNLPDFDNHPYGQEILDTMKKKVVLASSYSESNSLLAEFNNRADELGAVALTMTYSTVRTRPQKPFWSGCQWMSGKH